MPDDRKPRENEALAQLRASRVRFEAALRHANNCLAGMNTEVKRLIHDVETSELAIADIDRAIAVLTAPAPAAVGGLWPHREFGLSPVKHEGGWYCEDCLASGPAGSRVIHVTGCPSASVAHEDGVALTSMAHPIPRKPRRKEKRKGWQPGPKKRWRKV